MGEYHVGVQFGDMIRGRWTITLDGIDITDRCTQAQAVADDPGWAVLTLEPLACHYDHVVTELRFGHVTIAVRP
jgi:hypothetical protein